MGWARIDGGHQRHPKVIEAGPMAELLDVRAICYSADLELDGRIPRAALVQIGRGIPRVQQHVRKLVKVGRWREASRRDNCDGWVIHDFLDAQPSKAERDAERAAARARQRSYRARRNGEVTAKSRRDARRESRSTTQTARSAPQPPTSERDAPLDEDERTANRERVQAMRQALGGQGEQ